MTGPEKALNARKIPLVPLLIVLLLLGVAFFGDRGIVQVIKLSREKTALEEEIRLLEEANQALRNDIEALRSDYRYLEAIARKELGMVKEDELVYQFRTHGDQQARKKKLLPPGEGVEHSGVDSSFEQ